MRGDIAHAATVGVVTETNAEKAIEELKAYEVSLTFLQAAACTDRLLGSCLCLLLAIV